MAYASSLKIAFFLMLMPVVAFSIRVVGEPKRIFPQIAKISQMINLSSSLSVDPEFVHDLSGHFEEGFRPTTCPP